MIFPVQILLQDNVISSNKITKHFFHSFSNSINPSVSKSIKNLSFIILQKEYFAVVHWQKQNSSALLTTQSTSRALHNWMCSFAGDVLTSMAFPPPGIHLQVLPCFPMDSGEICLHQARREQYHSISHFSHHFYLPLLCTLYAYRKIHSGGGRTRIINSHKIIQFIFVLHHRWVKLCKDTTLWWHSRNQNIFRIQIKK